MLLFSGAVGRSIGRESASSAVGILVHKCSCLSLPKCLHVHVASLFLASGQKPPPPGSLPFLNAHTM